MILATGPARERSAFERPARVGVVRRPLSARRGSPRVPARAPHTSTPSSLRRCPSRSEPAPCTRTGISATDVAVAHRSQVRSTTSEPLLTSIQAAREQVAPQADAALAAAEKTRIAARGSSAARSRHRIKPLSAVSRARVTSRSRTRSCLSAREASSPRMWRADADAMRSPVNRTMPLERSEGNPANVPP